MLTCEHPTGFIYHTLIIVSFYFFFLGVDKVGAPNYSFSIRWLSATNHSFYSDETCTVLFSIGTVTTIVQYYHRKHYIHATGIVGDYTNTGDLEFHWENTVNNSDSNVSVIVTWQQDILIVIHESFMWTPGTKSNIFSFSKIAYVHITQDKIKSQRMCRQTSKDLNIYVQTVLVTI